MKLMWFHLMPYTELPEDFREKHPSVWVDIHSSLFDPKRAHHMYNDFMDELEFAAECGFDAVCVNEHHSNGYGLMPSPNLIASSLSRRTTDTAICVMGNSLALYNPPIRVAEEFAMLDVISGGRLIESETARPADLDAARVRENLRRDGFRWRCAGCVKRPSRARWSCAASRDLPASRCGSRQGMFGCSSTWRGPGSRPTGR